MKLNFRKSAAFLVALSMTASTMLYYPASVFGVTDEKIVSLSSDAQTGGIAEIQLDPEMFADLPDNSELFAGYVDKMFYGNGGVSVFSMRSRTAGSMLTGDAAIIYRALAGEIRKIASGERTSTVITIGGSNGITPDEPFTGSLNDLFDGGLLAALNALLLDYPYEMYWFDKTFGMGVSGSDNYRTGKISYCTISMPVAKAYAKSRAEGSYETDGALTSATSTAVATANNIVEKYAGYLDHQKLEGYKNEICDLVSYNYDAAQDAEMPYGDPWQMIYVFDKDPSTTVVCEGYAKAFQYLCDRTEFFGDISCYTITGAINGGHMWNIVTMEDGRNYLVDVTNSDEDTAGADGGLFLAGTRGSAAAGYTFSLENSARLTYRYDSNNPWGSDVLTLADSDYVWNTIAGDVVLNENITIASGRTLTILDGATLTIPEGIEFVSNGILNFLGDGQQLFGEFTGTGSVYADGVPHIHDMSGNAAYTQISDDDEHHMRVGTCFDCPLGYADTDGTLEPHVFDENGFCTACDGYEPAVRNTADVYEIGNAGQLYWFADKVNNSNAEFGGIDAALTADITVNENVWDASDSGDFRKWISIGTEDNPFTGSFNGNDHVISGLHFNRSSVKVGFFGRTGSAAKIANVGIVDSYFYGGANTEAGGLVSRNYGDVQNCYVMAIVEGDSTDSGGLFGRNYGTIANCYFSGNVTGADEIGALCGRNYGAFKNCYYNSDMTSADAIGSDYAEPIAEDVSGKTSDAFASGEVTYLLRGEQEENVWGQTLAIDAYPSFDGAKVYRYEMLTCGGTSKNPPEYLYSNDSTLVLIPETHVFNADGFCETCGAYESAEDSDLNGLVEIHTAGQLMWWNEQIQQDLTLGMELRADITLPEVADITLPEVEEGMSNWTAVGTIETAYSGLINGGNHTISGLTINADYSNQGFVGALGNGGVIKDLTLHDVQITADDSFVGAFAGYVGSGSIENCHVTGKSSVHGYGNVGGIVGYVDSVASVIACINMGTVKGFQNVGGIAGCVWRDSVIGCYQTGLVQSVETPAGAIVGFVGEDAFASGNYWIASEISADDGYVAASDGIGTGQDGAAEVDGTDVTWAAAVVGMNAALAENEHPEYWGMDLENDVLPSIGGPKVYAGFVSCADTELSYSNTEFPALTHTFSADGFCTLCDAYEPAVLNDEDVYEIGNAGQLYWFAEFVNFGNTDAQAVLTADITVNDTVYTRTWIPIGVSVGTPFMGTFDGQNYTISGLYFAAADFAGMFGFNEGSVENICLKDFDFSGGECIGGICGENNGVITNCAVFGTISVATAGGVCGSNQGIISNCFAAVNTEYSAESAGICYINEGVTLENCCFDTGLGTETAVLIDNGTSCQLTGYTSDELALGIAAYLLQDSQSENVWGQSIGTDPYPVLGGETVYQVEVYDCPEDIDPDYSFSNVNESIYTSDTHLYKNGACTVCGFACDHQMDEGCCMTCGMLEGIIKNMNFPTEYVYGDRIEIQLENFISNSAITQLTWSWYDADGSSMEDEIPVEPGTYQLQLTIPEVHGEDASYTEAALTLDITIDKVYPDVQPMIEDTIYTEGDAVPDISLPPDSVDGVIAWIHSLKQLAAGDNFLAWQFTPADEAHYHAETGTVVIYAETTTTTTETTTSTTTTTTTSDTTTTTTTTTSSDTTTTTTTTTTSDTTTTTTTTTSDTTTTTTSTTTSDTTTTTTSTTTSDTTTTTTTTATTSDTTTTTTTTTTSDTTTTTTTTTSDTTTTTTTTTTSDTTTTTTTTTSDTTPTSNTTTTTTTTTSDTTTTTTTTTTSDTTTTTTTTTTSDTTTTTTTTTSDTTTTTTTTTTSDTTTTTTTTTTTSDTTTTTTTTTTSDTTTTTTTTTSDTTTTTTTTTTSDTTTTTTTTTSDTTTTTTTTTTTSDTTTTTTTTTTSDTTTTTTTTTTSDTTTTTTTTTTSETASVVGYTYTVETKDPQFYFSDDENELQPEDLIESITRFAVYSDGTIAEEGEIITDLGLADFDGVTPEILYSDHGFEHSITLCITDEYGVQRIESVVRAYVGVKGDANMDGTADAKDAAKVLVYAAAAGAGNKAFLYSETDETMESFVFRLADVNGSGAVDAKDAAAILVYAAAIGSGNATSWEDITGAA